MKKVKWILITVVGLLALIGGGGWFALRSWVQKNATPDAVVQRIEAEWNCRADVKSVDVSLFSNPARIMLRNFSLSTRDAEVGKPLAQRVAVPSGPGILMVHHALLEVDTNALASGRLHVKKLVFSDVWLREEITPEGLSILQETFRKPPPAGSVALAPPPTITIEDKPVIAAAPPAPLVTDPVPPPLAGSAVPAPGQAAATARKSDLPFGLVVDEAVIEKVVFRIRNRQARTTTNLNDLSVRISNVDVDADNLAQHNQCKIELQARVDANGRAKVGEENKDVKLAEFTLRANGSIKPLDETTGQFSPHGLVTLLLKKGDVFGGTQTMGQAFGKDKGFAKLKDQAGIDVSDLVVGGALQEDVAADVTYEGGKVQFTKDVRLAFPEYTVMLRKDSWINGAADDHAMRYQLVPTEAVAKKIISDATEKVGEGLVKLGLSIFNDGQGNLAFDIASEERLSKPKTRLDGNAGAIEQLLRGLGTDLLKGLIK